MMYQKMGYYLLPKLRNISNFKGLLHVMYQKMGYYLHL